MGPDSFSAALQESMHIFRMDRPKRALVVGGTVASSCKLLNSEGVNSYEFDYMPDLGCRRCVPQRIGDTKLTNFRISHVPMPWAQGVGRSNRPAPTNA
jgi:hypothetical protein